MAKGDKREKKKAKKNAKSPEVINLTADDVRNADGSKPKKEGFFKRVKNAAGRGLDSAKKNWRTIVLSAFAGSILTVAGLAIAAGGDDEDEELPELEAPEEEDVEEEEDDEEDEDLDVD